MAELWQYQQQKAPNHCGTRLSPGGLNLPESVNGFAPNRGEQIIGYSKLIVHPKFSRQSKYTDSLAGGRNSTTAPALDLASLWDSHSAIAENVHETWAESSESCKRDRGA